MENTPHTPEPWQAWPKTNPDQYERPLLTAACGTAGIAKLIGRIRGTDEYPQEAQANARRIVACVNACTGIPTDFLEKLAPGELAEALTAMIQLRGG